MFFSEGPQAVFARPGKCRLNGVTTKTGDESCTIRKNRRRVCGVAGCFYTGEIYGIVRGVRKITKSDC